MLLKNVTSSKMQTNFYCTHPSCQLRRENERLRAALEPGRGSYSAVIVALLSCLEWLQSCLKHLLFCREPGVGGFNPLRRASAPAVAMVPVPGPTLPGLSAGTVVGSTAVGRRGWNLGWLERSLWKKYHDIRMCFVHVACKNSSMIWQMYMIYTRCSQSWCLYKAGALAHFPLNGAGRPQSVPRRRMHDLIQLYAEWSNAASSTYCVFLRKIIDPEQQVPTGVSKSFLFFSRGA